ncbi:MAG TPA: hypothetical protein VF702_13465 [Allosphingosinicella sp.]|jgi:hypothetical protein
MRGTKWILALAAAASLAAASGCAGRNGRQQPAPPDIVNAVDAVNGAYEIDGPPPVWDGGDGGNNAMAIDESMNTGADFNDMGTDDGAPEVPVGGSAPPRASATRPRLAAAPAGGGASGEEYCELVEAYVSVRHCDTLQRQRGALQARRLELIAPAQMYRDERADVRALLRRPESPATAAAPGQVRAEVRVQAASTMVAQLTGEGFEIEPAGWIERGAGPERTASWNWTVKPVGAEGPRTLRVVARPRLAAPGGPSADLEEYEATASVRVTLRPGTRSLEAAKNATEQGEGWTKALAALAALVTAAGALFAAVRKLVKPKAGAGAGAGAAPAADSAGPGK